MTGIAGGLSIFLLADVRQLYIVVTLMPSRKGISTEFPLTALSIQ